MGNLGKKFLKERERQKLSLEEVANVTKISARMLRAIEDEKFDQLPGGVFNKGFIRAYAKHLGIDGEEAVNEYLDWLRQAQIEASTAPPEASQPSQGRIPGHRRAPTPKAEPEEELSELQLPKAEHIRPMRRRAIDGDGNGIPWGLVVVALLLIGIGVVVWNRRSHMARAGGPSTAAVAPSARIVPVAATAPAVVKTGAHIMEPKAGASNSQGGKMSVPGSSQIAVRPAAAGVPPAQSGKPVTSGTATNSQKPAEAGEGEARLATAVEAAPVVAGTFTLVIRASENSWISVTADGKTVTQETLIAPAHTSVRASRQIVVRAGNAAGVSFLLNGKEIPAQGAEAEVKTLIFDSNGLQGNTPE